jgi:hypothetical protein
MLHFCLIFFTLLLNKIILLIINTLTQGFGRNIWINGKIMGKKIQALLGLVLYG